MIALLTLLLFAQLLLAQEPAPYACGPFLLQPGCDQMTVVVDHPQPVVAELIYGTEGGQDEQRVPHASPQRHHVFALTGLKPKTEYWYQVRTGTERSSGKRSFRTLPQTPDRYEVIVLGDVRSLPQRWHAVSERVFQHEQNALFVIGTGDYPSNGSKYEQWRKQFFEPARNLLANKPMWPAIGNHEMTRRHDDLTRPEPSKYFSLFELPGNERWYRVEYHLMTLLVVDSNSRMSPDHEQYNWLREQLRTERKRYTMVAFHHAPYTSGPHGRLEPDATPKEWPLDEARRFLVPLFEMYGVDVVLNGHDHLYERSAKGGIPYVVSGGGGAPLYKVNTVANPYQVVAKSTNHYVRLAITSDAIELSAVDTAGDVFDAARFPPRKENLTRRAHHIAARVQDHCQAGTPDLAQKTLPCTFTNPLGHAMKLQISMQEDEWQSDLVTADLLPGASITVDVPLAPQPQPPTDPWQHYRTGSLKVDVAGQEEALPIRFSFSRRIVLSVPRYRLRTIDNVQIDGVATEWQEVPAMRIGEKQPVPRGKKHYAGAEDFEADLQLAIDGTTLHVFVNVLDPDIVDDGTGSYFLNDSCNLVLRAPEGQPQAKSPTVIAFGASGRSNRDLPYRVTKRDGGYSIEASIPLAMTPFATLDSGARAAQFEVVFVDLDTGEGPSLHRLWTQHLRANVADYGLLESAQR
ncbi:MAG: metallophosphoesterase [Planctomycetota bacterium]